MKKYIIHKYNARGLPVYTETTISQQYNIVTSTTDDINGNHVLEHEDFPLITVARSADKDPIPIIISARNAQGIIWLANYNKE